MTITLASATGTQEDIEKALKSRGLEVEKPAAAAAEESSAAATAEEPKRDDFDNDDDYNVAVEAFRVEQEEKVGAAEEETDEEAEEGEEAQQQPKRRSKIGRRIDNAVRKATAGVERENAELKKRLEALEKGGEKEVEEKKDPNPRPVRSAFKSNEEYEDALVAWGTAKALAEKETKDAQTADQERAQQTYDHYKTSVEAFKEEHDDWDEVVNREDIPMHVPVQLAVMEMPNAAAVVYYLGKHPEYAKQLAAMSPLSAVMEVGRLSAKLKTASGSPGSGTGSGAKPKPKPRLPAPVPSTSTAATRSSVTAASAAKARDFKSFQAARRAGR